MARRFLQPLGKWFAGEAKTMVLSVCSNGSEEEFNQASPDEVATGVFYIYAMHDMQAYLTLDGVYPSRSMDSYAPADCFSAMLIAQTKDENGFLVINDIPENMLFYITDQEDGSSVSEDFEGWNIMISFSDR